MSNAREGGCQCGAVRYRLEGEPIALAVCHCTECQRQSGSAFGMSLIVPANALTLLAAKPRIFSRSSEAGRTVDCAFCADCGTRIYHRPARRPTTTNLKPGTLDDTSWLTPEIHVWTKSKQPWVSIPEGVRSVEAQP